MQLLYYFLFMAFFMGMIFLFHYLRTKSLPDLFTMIFTIIWFISFSAGNLGFKLHYNLPLIGNFDIYYSSSLYALLFLCILLVYICEGVKKAQRLIMVWIGAQLIIAVTQIFLGVFVAPLLQELGKLPQFEAAQIVFRPSYDRMFVSLVAAVASLFSCIALFQFMVNTVKRIPEGLRLFIALALALSLDSLIFVGGTRYSTFWQTLHSHLIFKIPLAAVVVIPFTIYLKWFQGKVHVDLTRGSLDIFKRIESLEDDLQRANQDLKEYAETLEIKVEQRTSELRDAKEEVEATLEELEAINSNLISTNQALEDARRVAQKDMVMAANLQTRFLPERLGDDAGWDVAFEYRPMSGVSGDFYDFYEADGALRGVSLFDVSGHGIASGLITLIAKSVVYKKFFETIHMSLSSAVEGINNALIEEIGHSGNYLTGVVLRMTDDGIEYVNAGHTELIIKRQKTGTPVVVKGKEGWKGWFLGIEAMRMSHKALKFPVVPGDVIIIYSDCLPEGRNAHDEEYGMFGILKALEKADASLPSEGILRSILDDHAAFLNGAKLNDDLTVVVMKKK